MKKTLYTIGYAGFPDIDDFVAALNEHGIQIVIDVRSSPYSAYHEQFNKDVLERRLKTAGIFYFNYAKQFGARQEDVSLYKNGRLDFELFSNSPIFLDGINRVEKSSAKIAFMCAEKHPTDCHRAILVTRAFSDRGHSIIHIKPNHITLSQNDVENELLDKFYPEREQACLFEEPLSDAKLLSAAYRLQNDAIGFKLEELNK